MHKIDAVRQLAEGIQPAYKYPRSLSNKVTCDVCLSLKLVSITSKFALSTYFKVNQIPSVGILISVIFVGVVLKGLLWM